MTDRTTRSARRETRAVRVQEPELSAETNEKLTDEVQDVVGRDAVDVPADRPHPSRGESLRHTREKSAPSDSFVYVQIGGAAIVVGAIIALITQQWWVLPLAAIVLGAVTYGVVHMILRMTSRPETPSPTTAAAMQEEGIRDPARHFSALVDEFTVETPGDQERTATAEDDPAGAAAEHRGSVTPTGGRSRAVGSGGGRPRRRESAPRH